MFSNAQGIDVKLRTDANSVEDVHFTILEVLDQNTDTEKKVVNLSFRQGMVVTKKALVDLATDNTLVLVAKIRGGTDPNPADVVVLEQTLDTPGNFVATANGANAIDLEWDDVTNATGYVLERATDAGFTANLTTLLSGDEGTDSEFADTGLTTATQYFYRVKAVGLNFTDSEYATDDATTA